MCVREDMLQGMPFLFYTIRLLSVTLPFYDFFFFLSLIQAFADYDTSTRVDLATFRYVVRCLLALKSSCNFILYCWFSEKFWTTFKRIFCLRHCLPRQAVRQPNGCNNASHNNSNNNSHNNVHRPSWYITRETTCWRWARRGLIAWKWATCCMQRLSRSSIWVWRTGGQWWKRTPASMEYDTDLNKNRWLCNFSDAWEVIY